jgi:hypothetical protein
MSDKPTDAPTPETDAKRIWMQDGECVVPVDVSARLERERDDALDELAAYKALAAKVDVWHTQLCVMINIEPFHPAIANAIEAGKGEG